MGGCVCKMYSKYFYTVCVTGFMKVEVALKWAYSKRKSCPQAKKKSVYARVTLHYGDPTKEV